MAKPATRKPSEYAGITPAECPTACNVDGCVISGKPYCAHPFKNGLQGADRNDPDALARFEAAKKILGKKKLVLTDA